MRIRLSDAALAEDLCDFLERIGFATEREAGALINASLPIAVRDEGTELNGHMRAWLDLYLRTWLEIYLKAWRATHPDSDAALAD